MASSDSTTKLANNIAQLENVISLLARGAIPADLASLSMAENLNVAEGGKADIRLSDGTTMESANLTLLPTLNGNALTK